MHDGVEAMDRARRAWLVLYEVQYARVGDTRKAFAIDRDDESKAARNDREHRVYIELAISSSFDSIISHFTCNNNSVRASTTQHL